MDERLSKLLLLLTTTTAPMLGGCSLIYSSDRLPEVNDAPPDTPAPVKGCELALASVYPTELVEGQGDGGSRPAIVVVRGSNIAPDAKITITAHESETTITPSFVIDPAQNVVDQYGVRVAVPVKVNVDADIGPEMAKPTVRLAVTVTQQCPDTGMPISVSLKEVEGGAPALTLKGLDELMNMTPTLPNMPNMPVHVFSRIDVPSTKIATLIAGRTAPLILRSMSSLTISDMAPLLLNANGVTPGPGGFAGGAGGEAGLGADGKTGDGPGGGIPNGGGAGFAEMGGPGSGAAGRTTGDASLTSLTASNAPNRGSGGAGGKSVLLGGAGAAGGGGGGAIELTAGGDLASVAIEAKGAPGGAGGASGGPTPGGGGSGGVVLLRAGRTLTVGDATAGVTVTGGARGTGSGAAGAGSVGRVRVDSPERTLTLKSSPDVGYRGPMFSTATPPPLIVREAQPRITVVGQPSAVIQYAFDNGSDMTVGPFSFTIPPSGEAVIPSMAPLFEGYNRLCVLVTGVNVRRDEAENCITLAYMLSGN